MYDYNKYGQLLFSPHGQHLTKCSTIKCPCMFKCIVYCIPTMIECDRRKNCLFLADEDNCKMLPYQYDICCAKQYNCIDQSEVCDGQIVV